MTPIRVGFIGLSKTGWAPGAHFPYLDRSPNYQIVAICNSSIDSSKAAIDLYKLPSETKAYGDPESLAKDPNIDLVVCSVRVDRHLPLIAPSLKAGKDVYIEWPLGANLTEAKELLKLKNEGGVKNAIVGLQARQAPIVKKLRELVDGGRVGRVLSSVWSGQAGALGWSGTSTYEYLARREVGGNLVSIHFGHSVDYLQAVLGYGFQSGGPKSLLANQRKMMKLIDGDGKVVEENYAINSDDTIFLNGTLTSGISVSMTLRGGPAFKSTPGLEWRIYGETGEIRITSTGPFLQIGYPDMKVQIHDFEKDNVETVDLEKDEFDEEGQYAFPARNVARVYKEYVEGRNNCSFEDAVERHELLQRMYDENGIKV